MAVSFGVQCPPTSRANTNASFSSKYYHLNDGTSELLFRGGKKSFNFYSGIIDDLKMVSKIKTLKKIN